MLQHVSIGTSKASRVACFRCVSVFGSKVRHWSWFPVFLVSPVASKPRCCFLLRSSTTPGFGDRETLRWGPSAGGCGDQGFVNQSRGCNCLSTYYRVSWLAWDPPGPRGMDKSKLQIKWEAVSYLLICRCNAKQMKFECKNVKHVVVPSGPCLSHPHKQVVGSIALERY